MVSVVKYDPFSRFEVTETGCWEWTGPRRKRGYGHAPKWTGESLATRLFYKRYKGPIPPGMCVCHTCDNPPCVNPDHLWLGTQADNIRDCLAKGRFRAGNGVRKARGGPLVGAATLRGTQIWTNKLSEAQVRAIRRDPRENRAIATDYSIHISSVRDIKSRKVWKWLPD